MNKDTITESVTVSKGRQGYINTLIDSVTNLKMREQNLLAGLEAIKRYLCSSKFHQDTTVQVGDILLRMEEIKTNYTTY
jgi:hypothetical protein